MIIRKKVKATTEYVIKIINVSYSDVLVNGLRGIPAQKFHLLGFSDAFIHIFVSFPYLAEKEK